MNIISAAVRGLRVGLVLGGLACGTPPDRPLDLAYDTRACDACAMLVSEPRFAVQLITTKGERHFFDDPACTFRWIAQTGPSLSHVWFRDSSATDEVWLDWSQVGFVRATGAPMDGGFAAVPASTQGALSFSAASGAVLSGAR